LASRSDPATLQVLGRLFDLGGPRGELRSVLVLSPPAEESQTALAVTALAHAAAAEGLQVLILEMTKATDAPAPPRAADGMLTVGGVMLADVNSDVFRLGLTPDLLEASGREGTATFKRLLGDALGSFDLVFIHSGAVASNLRFGALAPLLDAVLFVVRLGQTRQSDVVEAVESASLAGIPVSASVLLDG
jgi:Mrp family chromosome partitioning ATPase